MSQYGLEILLEGRTVQKRPLSDGHISIGRSTSGDIVLDHAAVSRNHARLEIRGSKVVVHDLGSGTGTLVGGVRVTSGPVAPGHDIQIGPYILRLVPQQDSVDLLAGHGQTTLTPTDFLDTIRQIVQLTRVVGVTDLKAVLEVLLERTMGLLAATRGYVVLVTDGGLSPILTHTGAAPSSDEAISGTICREAMEVGIPIVREIDPSVPEGGSIQSLQHLTQATLVAAIPLLDGAGGSDQVLGVMYLEAPQPGTPILSSERNILVEVARVGGRALRVAQERCQIVSDRDQWRWLAMQLDEGPDLFKSARSKAMQPVLDLVARVAPTDATVLIQGETGTGKEVLARAIHRLSPRKQAPFVAVNCAAVPVDLIEAELFGHEKGAFTGAVTRHLGRLEMARGGTIVLDEVGDMQLDMQAKLLRVLETRTFERLGGSETLRADVRILAATHRDLTEAVRKGEFREDLFYRLNVIQIRLPPLRDRIDDLESLVQQMLILNNRRFRRKLYGIAPDAMRELQAHSWPGNLRELRNVIERAFIVEKGDLISLVSLPPASTKLGISSMPIGHAPGPPPRSMAELLPSGSRSQPPSLAEYLSHHEVAYISLIMDSVEWNVARAADILKLKRTSLYRKLRQLGLWGPGQNPSDEEDPPADQ